MDSPTLAFAAAAATTLAVSLLRRRTHDAKKRLTPMRFDLSPAQIRAHAKDLIAQSDAMLDRIAALTPDEVTYENTLKAMDDFDARTSALMNSITFVKDVSPHKEVRDAGMAAQQLLSDYDVKSSMRIDVYRAIKAYEAKAQGDASLSAEQKRLLRFTVRDYERRGLHLDEASRAKVEELKTEINRACITYQQNLGEEDTELLFTREQLAGLKDDFVGALSRRGDKYVVTLGYPHVVPIMNKASNADTRRQVETAFNRRCIDSNVAILEKVLQLRRQLAALLGFKNHAAYALDIQMAKDPDTVRRFIEDLSAKLDPLLERELADLTALKRADMGPDAEFRMWDFRYYLTKDKEAKYSFDQEALKEYFPLQVVLDGMLSIYEKVLGIRCTEVQEPHVWHEEVRMLQVHDSGTGAFVGTMYLDLHPRPGKYGHAAAFPLVNGCGIQADGTLRQKPVAAMVANFTKPTATAPSLLSHVEVVTLFHEAGHVFHHLCSKTETSRFASFSCEQDYVEAPSQMLENWCWEPETLALMSGHYKDTSKKLPADIAAKLAATKDAHAGLLNKRQLLFCFFDQHIHTREDDEPVDTAEVWARYNKEVMRIPMTEGTNSASSFGHLMGGYDARYYSYMWSEVYAMDQFEHFKKGGLLSADIGAQYRRCILEPGGSRDAMVSVTEFLGRPPNNEAFLRSKGLL